MKIIFKIAAFISLAFLTVFNFTSCKKDKLISDSGAKLQFSQDSVLFDTVFTTIGSSTRNIRIRNKNSQPIKISSIDLVGGTASPFIINVDGSKGRSFTDVEIAANDSMYVFIQVNVNPNNGNSPLIINDAIKFVVNGNVQNVYLEAWGQDAYYHYPTDAIKFKDGTYLPFSYLNNDTNAITVNWTNDKPHVIYGYHVVYTGQQLNMAPGTRVYLNNKASLWVYQGGTLKVNGQKGNEVLFTGARRDKEYADEPGQWDRIWINEGSTGNEINYAIIKNGFIGIQAENIGTANGINPNAPRHLKLTNTKIQNMALWGIYAIAFNIYGGNNVISNCQEHCLNVLIGGKYTFIHTTFANFWSKEKARNKATININNHIESDVWPMDSMYFGNCIVDGTFANELNLDIAPSTTSSLTPHYWISNSWLKTNINTDDANIFINIKKGGTSLAYMDPALYDFHSHGDTQHKGFVHPNATADALKFQADLDGPASLRNTNSITAGAYEN